MCLRRRGALCAVLHQLRLALERHLLPVLVVEIVVAVAFWTVLLMMMGLVHFSFEGQPALLVGLVEHLLQLHSCIRTKLVSTCKTSSLRSQVVTLVDAYSAAASSPNIHIDIV